MAKPDDSSRRSTGEGLYPVRAVWLRAPREPEVGDEPMKDPAKAGHDTVRLPLAPRVDEVPDQDVTNSVVAEVPAEPTSPAVDPAAGPEPRRRTEEPAARAAARRVAGPSAPRWTAWLPSIAMVAVTAVAGWVIVIKLPGWLEPEPQALPPVTQSAGPTPPAAPDASDAPQNTDRIDYRSFTNPTGLTFTGGAVHAGATVRLAEGSGQHGAMWSAMTLDPARSFSTAFRFTSTGRSGTLSFVLRTQEVVSAEPLDQLIPRMSVDFMVDGPTGAGDAVTVISARNDRPTRLGSTSPGVDLDGGPVTVWIDYLAERQSLRVYASTGTTKPTAPVLTATVKLAATLGKGPAYAGFIASTADTAGTHEMLAWHLSPPAARS
ncbi:hypothetical protein ACWDV4_19720 [Micromonospora sp. NPDC003197]